MPRAILKCLLGYDTIQRPLRAIAEELELVGNDAKNDVPGVEYHAFATFHFQGLKFKSLMLANNMRTANVTEEAL